MYYTVVTILMTALYFILQLINSTYLSVPQAYLKKCCFSFICRVSVMSILNEIKCKLNVHWNDNTAASRKL